MTNPTTAAPNRSINQIISSGDVGGLVQKNKNVFIAVFVLLTALVIGYGLYTQNADETNAHFNTEIYKFDQDSLKKYSDANDGNVTLVLDGFKKLHLSVNNYPGLFPVVIKLSDALIAHKKLNEAIEVLNVGTSLSKNEYNNYFILARLAVAYEDLNQDQKAIETLEKMNSEKFKIFEGKIYLDLGRLYLKMGNKEKAKTSFQYVVDKANGEAEFVKVAKLYLTKV